MSLESGCFDPSCPVCANRYSQASSPDHSLFMHHSLEDGRPRSFRSQHSIPTSLRDSSPASSEMAADEPRASPLSHLVPMPIRAASSSSDCGDSSNRASTENEIHVGSLIGSLREIVSGGSFASRGIAFSAGSPPVTAPILPHQNEAGETSQLKPPTENTLRRQNYGAALTWSPQVEERRYRYLTGPRGSEGEGVEDNGMAERLLGGGLKMMEEALSWPLETLALAKNSAPLIVGFLLQYSLTLASVFSVGHLGKNELAAVSLATMTANLTGYALYQGFATALDTLCAQSYGAGRYTHVGLHFQRCVILLMLVSIPIGAVWTSSPYLLGLLVPQKELADLGGGYLQILFIGAPGYALFEAGKKYMQAQGIFHASTAVLAFLAPLNAVMNFLLVWDQFLGLGLGFYGAPMAVVITNWLMPICLALYVIFIDGKQCWHPLTFRAFTNWRPILTLALPGVAMIEAEFLAFELLTLFSSYLGTSTLAAQSILATLMSFIYQLPFAMSISSCTSVAQYVGAGNVSAARQASFVAMGIAVAFGLFDSAVLISVRQHVGKLFSSDEEVISLVAETLPVCACFQIVDVLASVTGGILRGQGRQHIAGIVQIPAYYGLAMPISLYTSFELGWRVKGLWTGCAVALAVIALVQTIAVLLGDWHKVVEEASKRVEAETAAGENSVEEPENLIRGLLR